MITRAQKNRSVKSDTRCTKVIGSIAGFQCVRLLPACCDHDTQRDHIVAVKPLARTVSFLPRTVGERTLDASNNPGNV